MDKILGLKNEKIKVGVAGDDTEYQQQQSSTLSTEHAPAKGHEKKDLSGAGEGESEEGKGRQRKQRGETETSRSIPPFTEGYGTTGSHEGVEEEKQHGFGNAV